LAAWLWLLIARKDVRKRPLLKLPLGLIAGGVIFGFCGINGGMFFERKLELRLSLAGSSSALASPSLVKRLRCGLTGDLSVPSVVEVEITLSEVLRLAAAILFPFTLDPPLTDFVLFSGFGGSGVVMLLEPDEGASLLEFHDSEPLSETVSELKLFFLNGLLSLLFALALTGAVALLANTVFVLLIDPHAWAFPVQPLWISVFNGVMMGTWYWYVPVDDDDRSDFSNDFCE
jgi:hypothetical protein